MPFFPRKSKPNKLSTMDGHARSLKKILSSIFQKFDAKTPEEVPDETNATTVGSSIVVIDLSQDATNTMLFKFVDQPEEDATKISRPQMAVIPRLFNATADFAAEVLLDASPPVSVRPSAPVKMEETFEPVPTQQLMFTAETTIFVMLLTLAFHILWLIRHRGRHIHKSLKKIHDDPVTRFTYIEDCPKEMALTTQGQVWKGLMESQFRRILMATAIPRSIFSPRRIKVGQCRALIHIRDAKWAEVVREIMSIVHQGHARCNGNNTIFGPHDSKRTVRWLKCSTRGNDYLHHPTSFNFSMASSIVSENQFFPAMLSALLQVVPQTQQSKEHPSKNP